MRFSNELEEIIRYSLENEVSEETKKEIYDLLLVENDEDMLFDYAYLLIDSVNEEDQAQCFAIFQKLADEGVPEAINNLAYCYGRGIGVEKSNKIAHNLYKEAALLGDDAAMRSLAGDYEVGIGTQKDIKKAIYWYEKAIECGNSSAALDLAEVYRDGYYIVPNYELCCKWYEKAIELGNPEAIDKYKPYIKYKIDLRDFQKYNISKIKVDKNFEYRKYVDGNVYTNNEFKVNYILFNEQTGYLEYYENGILYYFGYSIYRYALRLLGDGNFEPVTRLQYAEETNKKDYFTAEGHNKLTKKNFCLSKDDFPGSVLRLNRVLIQDGPTLVGNQIKYGLANSNGEVVVECKYDKLDPVFRKYTVAVNNGCYGVIDINGNEIVPLSNANTYTSVFDNICKFEKSNGEVIVIYQKEKLIVLSGDKEYTFTSSDLGLDIGYLIHAGECKFDVLLLWTSFSAFFVFDLLTGEFHLFKRETIRPTIINHNYILLDNCIYSMKGEKVFVENIEKFDLSLIMFNEKDEYRCVFENQNCEVVLDENMKIINKY